MLPKAAAPEMVTGPINCEAPFAFRDAKVARPDDPIVFTCVSCRIAKPETVVWPANRLSPETVSDEKIAGPESVRPPW